MQPVVLRSARLELSLPVASDADAMFEACQDPAIQRYTTIPTPYERRHAEAFISQIPKDWEAGRNLTWGIREAGSLVGTIGLYGVEHGAGEIGYWVAPWARGRRILIEAAVTVIDWGFSPGGLRLQRIGWRAVAGNVASARSARTLGFRYEGLLRRALVNGEGQRDDGWIAGLLVDDDRMPQPWPVLDEAARETLVGGS